MSATIQLSPAQEAYIEALTELESANETLSHAHVLPSKFDSFEVRKALGMARTALARIQQLDNLLAGHPAPKIGE